MERVDIDATQSGVGHLRADNPHVEVAALDQVGDVAAPPPEQRLVLEPADGLTDHPVALSCAAAAFTALRMFW